MSGMEVQSKNIWDEIKTVDLYWKRLKSIDKEIGVICRLEQMWPEQNATWEFYLELESKYLRSLRSRSITYKFINYKKV